MHYNVTYAKIYQMCLREFEVKEKGLGFMVSLSAEAKFVQRRGSTYWEPHSPHARRTEARGTILELPHPEKI